MNWKKRTWTLAAFLFLLSAPAWSAGARRNLSSELSRLMAKAGVKKDIVKPPKGLLKHEYLVPSGPIFSSSIGTCISWAWR